MEHKRTLGAGISFLLGAAAILGLLTEYAVLAAEEFIFDKDYNKFTITESVTHWIVVCVVWGFVGLILFYVGMRVYGFDLIKKQNRPTARGVYIALLLLSTSIGIKYLLLGGWQMAVDFKSQGWFQFIFLYIYYLFEAVLLLLGAAFFQECFEQIFKNADAHFPFGGLILSVSWGIVRYFTTGSLSMALFYAAVAFFIGCAHLAAHKNIYISYAFAAVLILV